MSKPSPEAKQAAANAWAELRANCNNVCGGDWSTYAEFDNAKSVLAVHFDTATAKLREVLQWYATAQYPDDGSGRPPEAYQRRAKEALVHQPPSAVNSLLELAGNVLDCKQCPKWLTELAQKAVAEHCQPSATTPAHQVNLTADDAKGLIAMGDEDATTPDVESLMTPEQAEAWSKHCGKAFDTMIELDQLNKTSPEIRKIARETVGKINEQLNIAGAWEQSPTLSFMYKRILEAITQVYTPLVEAAKLLREVAQEHADPSSPNYNECEKPKEECQWCALAKPIISAALTGTKNKP